MLVCLPYSSVIDRNIIENYGANIINIENINGEEALIKGLKKCSGKFILILKSVDFRLNIVLNVVPLYLVLFIFI